MPSAYPNAMPTPESGIPQTQSTSDSSFCPIFIPLVKRLLFCDDSIVRGTQLRDNVKILYDYGAKEVHMRIACPPLIYACPFVGFSASKNALELITRRIIKELEGDENKNLEKYATTGSPEYEKMVDIIAERFGLSSLKFNTLETLIEAIGLPKCKVCTHCFDGSSHF